MTLGQLEKTKHEGAVRIMIADDEPINRIGLKYLIASCPNFEVIAEASNGKEAVSFAESMRPDIILMDITMPIMDGISATKEIRKSFPSVKILMLTSRNGEEEISAALEAGANGYCLKDANPDRFMTALQVIKEGNLFLDSAVLPALVSAMASNNKKPSISFSDTSSYETLSEHELEILALRMKGMEEIDAAKSLNMTVEALRRCEHTIKEKIIDLELRSESTSRSSGPPVRICEVCGVHYTRYEVVCPADGSALINEKISRKIGSTVAGKFEILGFIGRGGGATVYKARHKFLNQLMAVKIIHAELSTDFTMLQRFRYEAESASHLNHPNIVRVHDFGLTDSGTPYLAMEYLEGHNLAKPLREKFVFSLSELVQMFWQVCSALEHAHSNGLVHRDVKPSNIFLTKTQQGDTFVKLVDFGLAKSIKSSKVRDVTQHGQIVGTPWYMSPESCKGLPSTAASDIYSLGCTLYESACGAPPFVGQSVTEVMYKHMSQEAPALPISETSSTVERQLAEIIAKCLQKDPADRFQSVSEIKTQLFSMLTSL